MTGDFEIHLTVEEPAGDALAGFAARHGLSYTRIELDRGRHRHQPMLNVACRGTRADADALAARWAEALNRERLPVRRVKIEAAPWNAGLPRTDAEAADDVAAGRYWEHHVKLRLPVPPAPHLAAVADLAAPHGARLSRNARRVRDDGHEERFVTQRCAGVGPDTAGARLDALLAALRGGGYQTIRIEREYVVSDTAYGLDAGWLDGDQSGW